jgi:hypothetical protein
VGCQGRERSVQDRGLVGPFIDPRRPDPGRFGFSGECRPKEAVGSGSRTGWEGARSGIRRPFGIGRMAARAIDKDVRLKLKQQLRGLVERIDVDLVNKQMVVWYIGQEAENDAD